MAAAAVSKEALTSHLHAWIKSSFGSAKVFQAAFVHVDAHSSTAEIKEHDCSPQLKPLHEKFMKEVHEKRPVPPSLMCNILELCNSNEDVEFAFQTLQKYRIYRSSKARVQHNFNENISGLAVSASLRSKAYGLGLKTLWRHNVYGISPSLHNAHIILSHARQEKNMDLMKKTFETMLKNLIIPTSQTAEIVIRICRDMEDFNLMIRLADEFISNDIKLRSPVLDILIATAANFGHVEKVLKVQKWREDFGLEHTTASAFAIARAHILQGEPLLGANVIAASCKDKVKVQKYLTKLVQSWPAQLLSKKEELGQEGEQQHYSNLKTNVVSFANALSKLFRGVSIKADVEYGKDLQNSKQERSL